MRKRPEFRWEHVPAMAFARAGFAFDAGVPAGSACPTRVTLPLFPARPALESSP